MKTYFITASTFCMERMLDCQKISDYLKMNGWRPVRRIKKAGLIIVSTCSFGREEDDSSLDYIRFYLRRKLPEAQFFIIGCVPAINPEQLASLGDIPTLSPTTLSRLDTLLQPSVKFADVPEPNKILAAEVMHSVFLKKALWLRSYVRQALKDVPPGPAVLRKGGQALKTGIKYFPVLKSHINPFLSCNRNGFYYLRISKGCLGSCSYCAKRHSTGRLRSKPDDMIVQEFQKGLQAGEKRFYLLTEDVGCYGIDQETTVMALLKRIFAVGHAQEFRIVVSNFNARWFVKYYDELEELFVKYQTKILYVQIPIQSGSTRILGLMDRHYTAEDLKEKLLALRRKAPALNLTTDMIAGFPGETDEDFELTKQFVSEIRFQHIDIFGYEHRPNTRAGALTGQLSQEVIDQRVFELARWQNKYSQTRTVIGKLIEVAKENAQRYRTNSRQ